MSGLSQQTAIAKDEQYIVIYSIYYLFIFYLLNYACFACIIRPIIYFTYLLYFYQ